MPPKSKVGKLGAGGLELPGCVSGRVKLASSGALGNIVVAAKDFAPGDIVIREPPALVIDASACSCATVRRDLAAVERADREGRDLSKSAVTPAVLAVSHGLEETFFNAIEAAVATSTAETVSRLVQHLYSPVAHQPENRGEWLSDVLKPSREELDACAAVLDPKHPATLARHALVQELFGTGDRDAAALRLLRFLHAVRVNTHGDEKSPLAGVFLAASKFTHACAPNTFWHFDREDADEGPSANLGHVVHVASRAIRAGEALTFSYLGAGLNMMTHAPGRRAMLAPLNFTCGCERCAAYDAGDEKCRLLPCPACMEKRRAARKPEAPASSCTLALKPGASWACSECKYSPGHEDLGSILGDERAALEMTLDTFFRPGSSPASVEALGDRWAAFQKVLRTFGREHYIAAVAACGLVRHLASFLSMVDQSDSPPEAAMAAGGGAIDFAELCRGLMGAVVWFEGNMRGTPQHVRFAAQLCVTLQLLHRLVLVASPQGQLGFSVADVKTSRSLVEGLHKKQRAVAAPFREFDEVAPVGTTAKHDGFAPL